jgi:adenylate kinase
MRLLIMGPPGAGKGTQAKAVAEGLNVPSISTGDIFRKNVEAGTMLGREAKRYLDAGEYVPDEITNGMVRARLDELTEGFLLDGYPRTVAQVEALDKILADEGTTLDRVLVLHVDQDELVKRLTGRAESDGRSDDAEHVIRRRLEVYSEQTEPLLDIYAQRGLLVIVNGMGEVEDVTKRVLAALHQTD